MKLTTNFDSTEFQTDKGELNLDTHHILILQAFRSWLGVELFISSGNRYPKYDYKKGRWRVSAHDIYRPKFITKFSSKMLTLPATGSDVYVKGLDSWELMDKVEEFENIFRDNSSMYLQYYLSGDSDIAVTIAEVSPELWTGKGCYPDTKNQCVHLDCSHRSLNPVLRDKRKRVKRWCRIDGKYIYAKQGESFAELRERVA